jgi:hypothetical protein
MTEKVSERNVPPLATMVALLLLAPSLPEFLTHSVFLVSLSIPAWFLTSNRPMSRMILKILAAPVLVLALASLGSFRGIHIVSQGPLAVISSIAVILFLLFCAGLALANLMEATEVSVKNIFDTITLYLVIGFVWAYIYGFLSIFDDSAFSPVKGRAMEFSDHLYFSFVTLTTLGYGDIAPNGIMAKTAAITEAIVGQFYVAVVITYLLSLFMKSKIQ